MSKLRGKLSRLAKEANRRYEEEKAREAEARFIGPGGRQDAMASTLVDANVSTRKTGGRPHKTGVDAHKGDRHKKDYVRWHARISPGIAKKVQHFLIDRNLTLREFLELASVHFMSNVDAMASTSVDAKTPYDDLMMYKTDDDIIIMYEQYTGNKWKPRDDRAGVKLTELDRRIIELGILTTLGRAKARINSFSYFVPEIRKFRDVNLRGEALDAALASVRRHWEREQKRVPTRVKKLAAKG